MSWHKGLAAIAVAVWAGAAGATTWYVDPAGTGNGTVGAPFGTWQQAINVAIAGDTIIVRSGVYPISASQREGVRITTSGTAALPITLRGEGATRPRLDCTNLTHTDDLYCLFIGANFWRFENIAISNARQPTAALRATGIRLDESDEVILNNVESFGHQGPGIELVGDARNNLLWNCDAHHNHDPLSAGANADGIAATALKDTAIGNRIIDSRAFDNSSTGFDLAASEAAVVMHGNWAFRNGFVPGTSTPAGAGSGFRLGPSKLAPVHRLTRNLSFLNRTRGFDTAGASGLLQLVNNSAVDNLQHSFFVAENTAHVLRNNLGIGTLSLSAGVAQTFNSWNLAVTADANDFVSFSAVGTDVPRVSGLLPNTGYLRLRSGSDLIDKGTASLAPPFEGSLPDLGGDEFGVSLFRSSME